jgi:N-methylhydantoinase B
MGSKMVGVKLLRGQHLRLETPGGGGYGQALDREPERVAEDVRLGYVSVAAAKADYAVIVAADGTLDQAATAACRKDAKA